MRAARTKTFLGSRYCRLARRRRKGFGVSIIPAPSLGTVHDGITAPWGCGHVRPPFDASWGARYAIVADPDGNDVGQIGPKVTAPRSKHAASQRESPGSCLGRPGRCFTCRAPASTQSSPSASSR